MSFHAFPQPTPAGRKAPATVRQSGSELLVLARPVAGPGSRIGRKAGLLTSCRRRAMILPTRRALMRCMLLVSLIFVLPGCGGVGTGDPAAPRQSDDPTQLHAPLPPLRSSPAGGETAGSFRSVAQEGDRPGSPHSPAVPADTTTAGPVPQTDDSAGSPEPVAVPGSTESEEAPASSGTVDLAGTNTAVRRLAERPRNNPEAADLLEHWGRRQSDGLAAGLDLSGPFPDDDAAALGALRTAVRQAGETAAPDLHAGDEVEVLGARRGVTYGRWAGGSADTLSIRFDVSRVETEFREDAAFRATLNRAGKAWSRGLADTWTTWERSAGELRGWLSGSGSPNEVRVGEDGVKPAPGSRSMSQWRNSWESAAKGGTAGIQPGESWEPHFGSIVLDRAFLQEDDDGRGVLDRRPRDRACPGLVAGRH